MLPLENALAMCIIQGHTMKRQAHTHTLYKCTSCKLRLMHTENRYQSAYAMHYACGTTPNNAIFDKAYSALLCHINTV